MTETKTRTRATAAKKVEETPVVETTEEVVEAPKAPKAPEKRVILDTDKITVMNGTKGMYGYLSANNYYIDLAEYGDTVDVPMGELRKMASSTAKGHLTKPWLIILDEDAIKDLRLEQYYENIYTADQIDILLSDIEGFKVKFPKMTKTMQSVVLSRVRQRQQDGSLYDNRIFNWIKELTGVDVTI